jgi:hypothetical protein
MKTYFLKFANETEARRYLSSFFDGTDWLVSGGNYALDIVGTIKTGGKWADDGAQIEQQITLDGFHVNVAIETLPDALVRFLVTPDCPTRRFA